MSNSYDLSQSVNNENRRREWVRLYAQARKQYPEVIRMLRQRTTGEAVADLGCGPGASLPLLKHAGFCWVLGIDVDRPALRYASRTARRIGLDFQPLTHNLLQKPDSLPAGVMPAAIAANVAIHTGFDSVFDAANRVLSPGGFLAIADRDYARLEVWDSPGLEALAALIRPLVMKSNRDYYRIEGVAAQHGFAAVAGDLGRWQQFEGERTLDVFNFIRCMNEGTEAGVLKGALKNAERDPLLSAATIRVVDKWFIFRQIQKSAGAINL